MGKRIIISEEEKKHIKGLYETNDDTFGLNTLLNLSSWKDSSYMKDLEKLKGIDTGSFVDKTKNLTSGERDEKDQTPVDFKKVTKKIIEKLEGGYYNPKWHFKSRMGRSGETMFGIDRVHGGTLNTGKAGEEFWNLIDKDKKEKGEKVWKHYYRGGSLENELIDLVTEIMKPHYERLSNKYLTPEAKKIVDSSESLL